MRAVVLAAVAAATIFADAGQTMAQPPGALGGGLIAPGSGFANGPPPAVGGGVLQAPGSGLSPSRAGTLDQTPLATGSGGLGGRRIGTNGLAEEDGLVAVPPRHRLSRQPSRRGFGASYPGVPDIIAPID